MKLGQSKKMSATTIRNILAFLLVIITIGAAAGFYMGLQIIKAYSLDVSHTISDSNASGKQVEQLSGLKQQLADGQALVTKADQLFSTPETFQTQVLKDVSKYASETGVTISNIESVAPVPGAATTEPSQVITLQSPVSYFSFLKFIDAIEGNLPKMQITGINIGRPAAASGDSITTQKITITVSTR